MCFDQKMIMVTHQTVTMQCHFNILHSDNILYNLGAMNGQADHKILDAIKHSEALIVPTLTDDLQTTKIRGVIYYEEK